MVTTTTATAASGRFSKNTFDRASLAYSLDQPAADDRTDRSRDAGEARPGAHSARPLVGRKRRLNDRERSRREQGTPDTLKHASADEHVEMLGASPHRYADASANHTTPMRKMRATASEPVSE